MVCCKFVLSLSSFHLFIREMAKFISTRNWVLRRVNNNSFPVVVCVFHQLYSFLLLRLIALFTCLGLNPFNLMVCICLGFRIQKDIQHWHSFYLKLLWSNIFKCLWILSILYCPLEGKLYFYVFLEENKKAV